VPGKPSLSAGVFGFRATWDKIDLAETYRVYYGTEPDPPAEAAFSLSGTAVDITDFTNDTLYYVWLRAENERGISPFSEAANITPHLPEPGEPVLTEGHGSIDVEWRPVDLAAYYNLYYSTSETCPAAPAQTNITGTSAVILGLVNDTPYYVWVEAVNSGGTSMSTTKNITLHLPAPENLLIKPGNDSIVVTWSSVASAASYNLYYAENTTRPAVPTQTNITGTSSVISSLTGGKTYYVWVESVNAGGTSLLNEAASGMPRTVWEIASTEEFDTAVTMINASPAARTFNITITANISLSHVAFNAASAAKTIVFNGGANLRSLSNNGYSDLFVIGANNTLVLGNNIKLNGNGNSYNAVSIEGGILVMKAGSVISNAKDSGVYVFSGTFTMEGGEISWNTNSASASNTEGGGVWVRGGIFTMSGGTISNNTAYGGGGGVRVDGGSFIMSGGVINGNSAPGGGGVWVRGGSFTMSGGTISGNSATSTHSRGGGVYVSGNTFTKTGGGTIDSTNTAERGRVVFVGNGDRVRNTTAGPNVNLNSAVTGRDGGWE
jgi:hypothetical protein